MNAKRWILFVSLIAIILVISRVFYGNIVEANRGCRCGCGCGVGRGRKRGCECGCNCGLCRGRGRRSMKVNPLYIYNNDANACPFGRKR